MSDAWFVTVKGTVGIAAVCFDFFNTLVFRVSGRGRGAEAVEYLRGHGFSPGPWRHEVLYEIFDLFDPGDVRHSGFIVQRLFESLGVVISDREIRTHVAPLWKILGPAGFGVFPEVAQTLRTLRSLGYALAIVSNWPRGLHYFCDRLGLAEHFDFILASGEVGAAKPDTRIFIEASSRLGAEPGRLLHIGDSPAEDYSGAIAAGFRALLIDRSGRMDSRGNAVIEQLGQLPAWLEQFTDGP